MPEKVTKVSIHGKATGPQEGPLTFLEELRVTGAVVVVRRGGKVTAGDGCITFTL